MKVITKMIQIKSCGENDVIDVTSQTAGLVRESGLKDGIITVFIVGSTAAITTIENEPGLRHDFPKMLSRIAPTDIGYKHNDTWQDGNGRSHVKASLIGPSLTIPFMDSNLLLGTWQQIVVLEMDTRPRQRSVVIQILGE
jgi:secondary thiamine-phosphate synthase enzyme